MINAVNTYTCVAGFKGEYNTAVSNVCRYITRVADSLGYIDTINPYAYCGNNPVNYLDPLGLNGEEGDHKGFWRKILEWIKNIGGVIPEASPIPYDTPELMNKTGEVLVCMQKDYAERNRAMYNPSTNEWGDWVNVTPYTVIDGKMEYVPPVDVDGDGDLDYDRDLDGDVDMDDTKIADPKQRKHK